MKNALKQARKKLGQMREGADIRTMYRIAEMEAFLKEIEFEYDKLEETVKAHIEVGNLAK